MSDIGRFFPNVSAIQGDEPRAGVVTRHPLAGLVDSEADSRASQVKLSGNVGLRKAVRQKLVQERLKVRVLRRFRHHEQ